MSVRRPAATDPLKLWILTAATRGPWEVRVLEPPYVGAVMNIPFPQASVADLVDALLELAEERLIYTKERGHRVKPDRGRVIRWFQSEKWSRGAATFGLTPAGGVLWEHACRANWRKYLDNCMTWWNCTRDGDLGDQRVVFEGATEERVRLYSMAYAGGSHVEATHTWRKLVPWKATYWKTLPSGVRLTCLFKKREHDPRLEMSYWPLWDLGRWHEFPPRVHEPAPRIPVRLCIPRRPDC